MLVLYHSRVLKQWGIFTYGWNYSTGSMIMARRMPGVA